MILLVLGLLELKTCLDIVVAFCFWRLLLVLNEVVNDEPINFTESPASTIKRTALSNQARAQVGLERLLRRIKLSWYVFNVD